METLRSCVAWNALLGVLVISLGMAPLAAAAPMTHAEMSKGHMAAGPSKTLTGEVVDTGCYLAHSARGAKHVACANKCIAGGMPMGLLTADGTLYLLTLDHENGDPYNQLKSMAGKTVSVSGPLMTRGGMKGIDVMSVKLAATAAR